jgi:SIT4-associating protein SAP185/190
MFWRFGGYANISTIDTLLDKPDTTLEDLLDESDLIQELKAHNTKLIEFLRDEDRLKKLLNYVVAPGPPLEEESEDFAEPELSPRNSKGKGLLVRTPTSSTKDGEEQEKAEKQRLKYAYTACEVLSSETWSILEALMSNVPHLTEFWDFLRRPPPLDPLQAGYFTKVNETLLDKKTEEMLEFFKSLVGIVPAMLQHVDCPMVMDLLLKIISLEKSDGGHGIVDWLQSQDLIPTLLSNLSPDCNSATQTSAGDFLKAIITISANAAQNEQSCIGPNSLTRQLVSEACISSLISSMLQGGNPLTVGVGIVIEVIRKNNSDYDPENGHNPDAPPTSHDPIYLGTLLRMFAKHVPDFMELILSSHHTVTEGETTKVVERGKLSSAWGTQIEPLGFDRFKTCELMAELLHCSNMGLLNEKGSEEAIRQRDAERERLKLQGDLSPARDEGDSGVDISADSSKFVNGINTSMGGTPQALRLTNSSEEDGFEKVAVSDISHMTESSDSSASSGDTFTRFNDRSEFDSSDDFTDEPLASPKNVAQSYDSEPDVSLTLPPAVADASSPTTANIEDRVRRISMEDTNMSSPPNESNDTSCNSLEIPVMDTQNKIGDLSPISPHPEDRPAPLFSKSSDPNKTPTPMSPNGSTSPNILRNSNEDPAGEVQQEGDTSINMGDDTEIHSTNAENDAEDETVVGDYLKIMFVKNNVVSTILVSKVFAPSYSSSQTDFFFLLQSFFFRFPWNNFLHNVVYDVIQQVFNGPMERGYNRNLAIDLFETGNITEQIVDGQKRSDEAQQQKNMRLGYMGHLTLVAEEVVKFSERHPAELLSQTVMEKVLDRQWIDYVEQTLSQTRERDNAVLGGIRPDIGIGSRQAVLSAVNASQGFGNSAALANAGLNGGQQPLDTIDLSNNGSASSGTFSQGAGSSFSSFGGSSDDEDEDMDEPEEDDPTRTVTPLSTADTGLTLSNVGEISPDYEDTHMID